MAIIVEDGTGRPDSESFISVGAADAYWAKLGNPEQQAEWAAATVPAKEAAVCRASQHIDANFIFLGSKLDPDQALALPTDAFTWPMSGLVAACSELSLRALSSQLDPDTPSALIKREKVGPIETEFDTVRRSLPGPAYNLVRRLLRFYILNDRIRAYRA